MSSGTLPIPPRGNYQGSQLRYVSSRNDPEALIEADGKDSNEPSFNNHLIPQDVQHPPTSLVCTLGIHDDGFSTDEILLNASVFPVGGIPIGASVQLLALETESPSRSFKQNGIYDMRSRRSSGEMHVPSST